MDAQQITIAHTCLNAAIDKSMAFPEIVSTLITGGFEGYIVDYRRGTTPAGRGQRRTREPPLSRIGRRSV